MKKYFCDCAKCGKELSYSKLILMNIDTHHIEITDSYSEIDKFDKHLCSDCFKKIYDFIKQTEGK